MRPFLSCCLALFTAFISLSALAQKGQIDLPRCTTKCDRAAMRQTQESSFQMDETTPEQVCSTPRGEILVSEHSVQLENGTVFQVIKLFGQYDLYRTDDGVLLLSIANPSFPGTECKTIGSALSQEAQATICSARLVWGLREPETFSCRRVR